MSIGDILKDVKNRMSASKEDLQERGIADDGEVYGAPNDGEVSEISTGSARRC